MKHIIIDTGRASTLNSGLGQVVYLFASTLERLRPEGLRFTFLLHRDMVRHFAGHFDFAIRVSGALRRLLPNVFAEGDLWHVLNPDSRSVPLRHAGLITTIHDLRILNVKKPGRLAGYRQELQDMLDHSIALTAISDTTRQGMLREFTVPDIPFPVIYNGITLPEPGMPAESTGWHTPYLFSIGQFEPKKRFHLLVEMLPHLPDYRLLLAGNSATDYGQQVRDTAQRLGVGERVQLVGQVDEATKWRLYREAAALVFPSSLEGFGLPLLEAMGMGTPAFASRDPALLEIGGTACHYFDTLEPAAMARQVVAGLSADTPDSRRHRLEHARSFSWEHTVNDYLALYRKLLSPA